MSIVVPEFQQVFKWWAGSGHFHRLAGPGDGTPMHHTCAPGWVVPPQPVRLPFGYVMVACEGCGLVWETPEPPVEMRRPVLKIFCEAPEFGPEDEPEGTA